MSKLNNTYSQYHLIIATLLSAALLKDKQHEVAPHQKALLSGCFLKDGYADIESDITSDNSSNDERTVFGDLFWKWLAVN